MKKFLLILLLMLPFQACWSAASAYCQHEAGKGAAHFGHHFHEHQGEVKADDGGKTKGSTGHTDADCGFCHSGTPAPLLSATAPTFIPLVAAHAELLPVFFTSHIPEGLMRPDWRLVA